MKLYKASKSKVWWLAWAVVFNAIWMLPMLWFIYRFGIPFAKIVGTSYAALFCLAVTVLGLVFIVTAMPNCRPEAQK